MENLDLIAIDWKVLLASIAIVISLISLSFTSKNARRQIRVVKIEEMLEIILSIVDNYSSLKKLFDEQQKIRDPEIVRTTMETISWKEDYSNNVDTFKQNTDINKFRQKLIRLSVLSNSYLPNKKVKYMILTLVDLTANLCQATIVDDYEFALKNYPNYPEPNDFLDYIEKIQSLLVKEMKLGYESAENIKFRNYKENFKKELKII